MLHTEVVKQIWRVFGQAQVDLFATQETAQCPLWYSLVAGCYGTDVAKASSICLYRDCSAPRSSGESALGRGPAADNSPILAGPSMVLDLISLLDGSPWEIPVRRNLLSQAEGTLVHPRPELWKLWVWPLRGHSS